jgi:hypothetical protein
MTQNFVKKKLPLPALLMQLMRLQNAAALAHGTRHGRLARLLQHSCCSARGLEQLT